MGNSMARSCSSIPKERVIVMREDGSLLVFKHGVRAKEVMGAHEGHCVVRCCFNRTVLTPMDELESRRLYFLMPGDAADRREAYESFWRVGEMKGLVPPRRPKGTGDGVKGRVFLSETPELKITSWRPGTRSVLEITSSTRSSHVVQQQQQQQQQPDFKSGDGVTGGNAVKTSSLVSVACESCSFSAAD